jgi:drug/metabolite transporter (DMT)-like permease
MESLWFVLSLLALLAWSGSDIFSKIGTQQNDKNSHWKVVFAVGFVMGIHFLITVVGGIIIDNTCGIEALESTGFGKMMASLIYTDFTLLDFVKYLPVAGLYILAMVFGYMGLRYIELSISSPICNCSGAMAFLLCIALGSFFNIETEVTPTIIVAVILITVGIVALGFIENLEDEEVKAARQEKANRKYSKSVLAFLLPVVYLVIDALGTFADEIIFAIEGPDGEGIITDYAANSAFELTFFVLAVFAFIWVKFVKKDTIFKGNKFFFLGGICETIGQAFYMAVMFAEFEVGMVIICAYCALSVLWGGIFLKEKLSWKHYAAIACAFVGIMLLG